jgi:hypothetical protein
MAPRLWRDTGWPDQPANMPLSRQWCEKGFAGAKPAHGMDLRQARQILPTPTFCCRQIAALLVSIVSASMESRHQHRK